MEVCKEFSSDGICREGVGCKFHHDYKKPLSSNQLRIYLDTLVSDMNQVRDDILEVREAQNTLSTSLSALSEKVGKIKKDDQDIKSLTSTVADLVDKLKDAGISQLHFDLQPTVPGPKDSRTDQSLSNRAQSYMKHKKGGGGSGGGGNRGGKKEQGFSSKRK